MKAPSISVGRPIDCRVLQPKFRPRMNEILIILEQLQDFNESRSNSSNNNSSTARTCRRSADNPSDRRSTTAYPRPSASPLYD
ncbi:hypothetical protein ES332_D06G102600v1 [Gossypium tomentosum]|uniref:Uncharacterized protein n=1 Tax=Gossypium tomentosum TaxID=34277 RepID=A0A5D2KH66_GOSTO|nr:hypothetical protein ES332_D06G102600v1 [Gossypium tomentosum]